MKKWYLSKMVWLGVLSVVMSSVQATRGAEDWQTVALAVVGGLIVVLRSVTTEGIR